MSHQQLVRITVAEYERRTHPTILLFSALCVLSCDAMLYTHSLLLNVFALPSILMYLLLTAHLSWKALKGPATLRYTALVFMALLLQSLVSVATLGEVLQRGM